MAIRFIYFDLGKVILDFDHELACRQVADLCGVSADKVREGMYDSGLENAFELGKLSPDEFAKRFFEAIESECDVQALLNAMSNIFTINEPIVPLIRDLHAKSFPIGVLSNTCIAHWDWARRHFDVLSDCFAIRILSFEEYSMKPEPAIYEAAISAAGVAAEEIFFVDDLKDNVAGANSAGLDAVLYESVPKLIDELKKRSVLG